MAYSLWLMAYCLRRVAEARPDRGRGGGVRGGLGRSGEATLPDASRERARQELQLSLPGQRVSRASRLGGGRVEALRGALSGACGLPARPLDLAR